jgi:hypothetical protein
MKIIATSVALLLASSALPAVAASERNDPGVRCEGVGYVQGTEQHTNCVFVVSHLDQFDNYFQVKSFAKCFDSSLWAARCVAWYSRDAARETIDEEAVKQFNAMMEAKFKAEERCRSRLGKVEITTAAWATCITAESKELYASLGINEAVASSFDATIIKSKEMYDALKRKSQEYYVAAWVSFMG